YQPEEFKFYLSRINAKALVVNAESQADVKDLGHSLGLSVIEVVLQQQAEAGIFELHCAATRAAQQTGFSDAEDVALILHTSGTTSAPKIVPLTHNNI